MNQSRHSVDANYKANRAACPQEVSVAANRLMALLPTLGLPAAKEVGWEADDVIGTLAVQAVEVSLIECEP